VGFIGVKWIFILIGYAHNYTQNEHNKSNQIAKIMKIFGGLEDGKSQGVFSQHKGIGSAVPTLFHYLYILAKKSCIESK
jgi:hypothetical protein